MVYSKDTTWGQTRFFDALIQVLEFPNEFKVGYSPIGFVRCGRGRQGGDDSVQTLFHVLDKVCCVPVCVQDVVKVHDKRT